MSGRLLFVPEPFYLVGPTAVGKTDLAARTAELCGAEIVNADAFQVYAGLARLTALPSAAVMARVRHHLVGYVPLAEAYNVARYRAEAVACLRDLSAQGKQALIVGGSGMYVKALTHGLSPLPPAQAELRVMLEDTALAALMAQLESLDPATAAGIDRHNKRRVVRAVEICLLTGRPVSELRTSWQAEKQTVRGVLVVRDRDDLAGRISRRTAALLDESSVEEVRVALHQPVSDTAAGIIGFAEVAALLYGQISRAECLERIETATRRYAKRQMTWFRREAFAETIHLTTNSDVEAIARTLAARITAA